MAGRNSRTRSMGKFTDAVQAAGIPIVRRP